MYVCIYIYICAHIHIHTTHTTKQAMQQCPAEFVFWVHRVRISTALPASLTDFSFIVLQSLYYNTRLINNN